MKKYSLLN